MSLKKTFAGTIALGVLTTSIFQPGVAHAAALRAASVGTATKTPPVGAVPALPGNILNASINPALSGGVSFSVLPSVSSVSPDTGLPASAETSATVESANVSAQTQNAATPPGGSAAASARVMSSARTFESRRIQAAKQRGSTRRPAAFASISRLAGRLAAAKTPSAAAISRGFFDGRLNAAEDLDGEPIVGSFGAPANRSGLSRAALDGSDLARLYPRVVFLQDVFKGPASEQTVQYVQSLVDAGVHVVFMTWRAQKGEGSAEDILLGRIKTGRTNPVMVVSYNGGKIALHSRAKNPVSLIEDVSAFTEEHIAVFREITAATKESLDISEDLREHAGPSEKSAFVYSLRISNSVADADLAAERNRVMRSFNARLASSKLPYKMQAHPDDPRAIMMQSMPLRFSMKRVVLALERQFRGEGISENPDTWLILSDSKTSPKFTKSFPKQAEIQVVRSGEDVENLIGAVLGDRTLKPVSLKLGKLRQFVEYWEPSRAWRTGDDVPKTGGGGGGSVARGAGERLYNQKFAMFTGSVIYQLMAWFYEQVFRGQHKLATLKQLELKLHSMWRDPGKNGVYVNKELAVLMKTPQWREMSRGYLNYTQAYLRNFWFREFGDYSAAAAHVMENFVGLATDRKSLITLNFKSPSTGRLYKIFTRIPRVMKLDTAKGRILTAHAYRTGKETPDDGEEIYAKTLAMALLVGHGRKGKDGKWHHGSPNGPALANLEVQFEYRSSNRVWTFNADELLSLEDNGNVTQGPIVQELTSTIERMEADEEYQAYYLEQEQQATKEDLKKKTRGPSKKKAPAKKKPAAPRQGTGK